MSFKFYVNDEHQFFDILVQHQVFPECFDGDDELESLYEELVTELFETGMASVHGNVYILHP